MRLKELQIWIDDRKRAACEQMAVDEALFLRSRRDGIARLRCYEWAEPAVTIGYFEHSSGNEEVSTIRRITGGGTVYHGEDVTFCLVLPSGTLERGESTGDIYRQLHLAFRGALGEAGFETAVVDEAGAPEGGPCFVRPVQWDLLGPRGEKVLGGALRRSGGAVIYQGSARLPESFRRGGKRHPAWVDDLCARLSDSPSGIDGDVTGFVERVAADLARGKYQKKSWNLGKVR